MGFFEDIAGGAANLVMPGSNIVGGGATGMFPFMESSAQMLQDPFGHGATKDAVAAQTAAADQANATQRYMYDTTRADFAPWRETGLKALSGLSDNNFMNNWQADPGYQFRLSEGMKALENSASARGNLNSGATMKALTRFGQDYGSQEYGNVFNREYGRLSQLAGLGQASTAGQAASGMNYANQVSQNQTGLGNANAAAQIAQANRNSQMLGTGVGIAALAACDERVKKNIEPVSHDDLAELKSVIKPYHFEYIAKDFGDGQWVGIMAQDLEKSKLGKTCVVEDEKGVKRVDLKKLLSLLIIGLTFEEAA